MTTGELTKGTYTGEAGGRIHWRRWPAEDPRALVVIVHGYGEHGGRYARLAARLVDEGFEVWAADHRGHGMSEGPRGVLTTIEDAVADVDRLVDLAVAERPGIPVFMLAHSMGGAIGLRYALTHQDRLDGLILSSAAVSLEGFGIPAIQRRIVKLIGRVAPKLPVNKLPLHGISRDPEEVRIYDEDPLVHRGAQPARTVSELLEAMATLPGEVTGLRIPLLVVAGTDDPLVPAAASRDIAARAGSADKTLTVYDGFVHELINEPPEDRERVTQDLVDWLGERAGGGYSAGRP